MDIASAVVRAVPGRRDEVRSGLRRLRGAEIHAETADGRLSVTVEDLPGTSAADTVVALHRLDGVLAAAMVYQYSDRATDTGGTLMQVNPPSAKRYLLIASDSGHERGTPMSDRVRSGSSCARVGPPKRLVWTVALFTSVVSYAVPAPGAERSGKELVESVCVTCHGTGAEGAPKIGDRAAWATRLSHGIDQLVSLAIRGHGAMPARGGMADTTDAEIRNAILYMFNPGAAVASAPAKASAAAKSPGAVRPGGKRVTVGGMEVYLGLTSAEALRAYPKDAPERAMHGGIPGGAGQYHVNISLFDAESGAAIADAKIEAQVDEVGMTSESKQLESMVINNTPGYGSYFRLRARTSYLITVRVEKPGSSQPVEARFEHRTN